MNDQGESKEATIIEDEDSDRNEPSTVSSTVIAPATKHPRECQVQANDSSNTSSSMNNKEQEQLGGPAKKKTRCTVAVEEQTEFPLIPLLNSYFFFGTSLSIVNREAAEHTRNLASYGNKITRFLQKRCSPEMYYKMYSDFGAEGHTEHGPATTKGPTAIVENSMDVFMVSISMFGYRSVDTGAENRSLASLAQRITDWWNSVGKTRIATSASSDDFCLPSGHLVDVSPHFQNPDTMNGTISHINLRGAVVRGYMKHNNLFRSVVSPLDTRNDFSWWIVTSDEHTNYDLDVSINVYRNVGAFEEHEEHWD